MKKITTFLLTLLLIGTAIFASNGQKAMAFAGCPITEVQSHVEGIGWMPWDNAFAGTTGKGLRLEAIKIRFLPPYYNNENLHVQYRVHVQNIGWMPWVRDGEVSGTTGQSLSIEAVQMKIVDDNGNMLKNYSIGTEVAHVENLGWIIGGGDGCTIGTTGQGLRLEAFNVFSNYIK
ncbi:hypothetical protein [Clostridium gasigenes]|uniref:Hydrophobic W protein n=1 Tax=Clostridium gasigenes TaxID=94869 RepID=A0A7X0SFE9_9CLOT|nr:hypothetical protein [Clostridium gasigenes]MBB6716592.1 hypothetical protein [Clostridium gasigenes]